MRILLASLLALIFLPINPVFAQVGPCGSGDTCASGQACIGAVGSRFCYQNCTEGSTSCPAPQTCRQPTGISQTVCADPVPTAPSTSEPVEEAPPEAAFIPITPELGVPIPGLNLVAPTREGQTVRVAFLAGYINAVYRYLTAIILVVAIVMVVYGGFLYLVGSAGVGSIQKGKTIIIDAIMGLLITLAAYAILNTVSPGTTQLKTLELGYIAGEVTEEPGGIDYGEAASGSGAASCSASRRGSSDTTYDAIFQRYAGCAGLDWRILKAVAYKESGFRECVTNRYGFTGLFQVRPDTCALRRFGRAADCNRLINPEINTAAAAVGQLRAGADLIHRLCPTLTDARRYVALLYFGHNSGAGALQAVIRDVGCNASDAEYDRSSTEFWEARSTRLGRSLPPNHDARMSFARTVADTAVGYGVTTPTMPRSSCPVI